MSNGIPGFTYHRVPIADGVALNTAVGGSGPAIVLLHGFPQTHFMWRHVAADLAADRTVICPDLRGYGASDKPAETGPDVYSKRTMAADIVALARALGHERFALAATTAARSSPSAPASTTPRPSPTWPVSTCSPPSTCGTSCRGSRPPSDGTSISWPSLPASPRR